MSLIYCENGKGWFILQSWIDAAAAQPDVQTSLKGTADDADYSNLVPSYTKKLNTAAYKRQCKLAYWWCDCTKHERLRRSRREQLTEQGGNKRMTSWSLTDTTNSKLWTQADRRCSVSSPNTGGASGKSIHFHLWHCFHPPPPAGRRTWRGQKPAWGPQGSVQGGNSHGGQTILPCYGTGRCDLEVLFSALDSIW